MLIDWLCNRLARGRTRQSHSDDATSLMDVEALLAAGDTAAAEARLRAVLADQPRHFDAHLGLAKLYVGKGEYDEASKHLQNLDAISPRSFEVPYLLGLICARTGRHHQAILHYKEALKIEPHSAEAHIGLGDLYEHAGNVPEARRAYLESIKYQPTAYANIKVANSHMQENDPESAARYYNAALEHDSDNAEIYRSLGAAYRVLGQYDKAEDTLKKCLAINPHDGLAHEVMGLFCLDTGYPQQAREHFMRSIDLGNDTISNRRNLCASLQAQCNYRDAMQCLDKLFQRENDVVSRWNHALLMLMSGDFTHGWQEYEYRNKREISGQRAFDYPTWNGEDLSAKTILIYGEQGLGDELMFASCLNEISSQADRCLVECDERIAELVSRSFPHIEVYGSNRKLADPEQYQAFRKSLGHADIDYQLPVGSLPLHFRRTVDDFPQHQGYLHADPGGVEEWRERLLSLGAGPKVGISWRGGVPQTRQYLRSIPLVDWLPVLSNKDLHFISLQYGDCIDEIHALSDAHDVNLHHWPEAIDNLDKTAALISALDLVISVQTTVVHLTGALGRPAWALVPYSPEWRYMASGSHMPWYPSVTVMRQQALRDWSGVIQRVADQLQTGMVRAAPA